MVKITKEIFDVTEDSFRSFNEKSDFVTDYGPFSLWTLKSSFLQDATNSKTMCKSTREKIENFLQNPAAQIRNDKGCCYVLFYNNLIQSSIFDSACALPLQWRENTQHDPHLPPSLQNIAQKIYQQQKTTSTWGLWLGFENCDLSDLDGETLSADSGWATLTAALTLAIHNGTPNNKIWASAAWGEHGIKSVEHIAEKLQVVARFQGQMLFVCEGQNYNTAIATQQKHCKIQKLTRGEHQCSKVLANMLSELNIPPSKDADMQLRKKYYSRQVYFNKKLANDYYENYMQEDLAKECASKTDFDLSHTKNLISFVSYYPSYRFILYAIQPQNLLLFYTKETITQKDDMLKILKKRYPEINIQEQLYENENSEQENQKVRQQIRKFVDKYNQNTTALDVTPGTKNFTLQGVWALSDYDVQLLYLCHDYDGGTRSYRPGNETIKLLRP